MKKYDIEVLAPVGNKDMLIAAVKAGAQAVYLGGKLFSARAYAENFTIDNLKETVKFCHKHGVKVYLTVNTLLHDYELNEAVNYIIDLYNEDVDAVIVQDMGLAKTIKKIVPNMPLHASTQINVYNYFGAKIMQELGFSRVVLARETPIDEIRYIAKNLDIELEVFIHGSLCVATSGQCLMSSYIGGRSGNRGKCAQPCRKEYEVYDSDLKLEKGSNYKSYLSPKDLCTIENVEELRDIGVKSFKIEGRMKKPEYVYSVVKTYKNKLENQNTDITLLDEVSNRGFTKGLINYDYGKKFIETDREKSKKGVEIGVVVKESNEVGILLYKNVYKGDILLLETKKGKIIQYTLTKDVSAKEIIYDEYFYDSKVKSKIRRTSSIRLKEELLNKKIDYKKSLKFKFIGKIDKNPVLELNYNNINIIVEVEHKILPAINQPMSIEKISEQLSKLGNTEYSLENIDFDVDDSIFIPVKKLNELRRKTITSLDNELSRFNNREHKNYVTIEFESIKKENIKNNYVNVEYLSSENKIDKKLGKVYLNELKQTENKYYYKLPRLATTGNLIELKSQIIENIESIDGFLVNNIGDILYLKKYFPEGKILGDIGLNVLNSKTYEFFREIGLEQVTLSTELNTDEINKMLSFIDESFEIIAYGNLTSMVMRNCPFSSLKGCINDKGCKNCEYSNKYYLKDKTGEYFLVNRFDGYSELYNSKILNSYDVINEIDFSKGGSVRLILEFGNKNLIKIFYDRINKNKDKMLEFNRNTETKGHFNRGIN